MDEQNSLKRTRRSARGNTPEINHLNVPHPSEHAQQLLRALDPRTDDREFAETRQAVEWTWILEEVVVEVEHPDVGYHSREIRRELDQATCRELEVDEVVARFREEAGQERIACVENVIHFAQIWQFDNQGMLGQQPRGPRTASLSRAGICTQMAKDKRTGEIEPFHISHVADR